MLTRSHWTISNESWLRLEPQAVEVVFKYPSIYHTPNFVLTTKNVFVVASLTQMVVLEMLNSKTNLCYFSFILNSYYSKCAARVMQVSAYLLNQKLVPSQTLSPAVLYPHCISLKVTFASFEKAVTRPCLWWRAYHLSATPRMLSTGYRPAESPHLNQWDVRNLSPPRFHQETGCQCRPPS